MQIVYALEPLDSLAEPVIFLAGPTPRSQDVASWRPSAIAAFEQAGFAGTLLVPEDRDGTFHGDYQKQVHWEHAGLSLATVILFYVPRSPDLPGFTTNIELGLWARSGKVVLGAPPWAEKMRYPLWMAGEFGIKCSTDISDTVADAIVLADQLS